MGKIIRMKLKCLPWKAPWEDFPGKAMRTVIQWTGIGLLSLCSEKGTLLAQSGDTSLAAVYAQSFFFNVVQGKDGRVYAGSSDGVFEMQESEPRRQDGRVGYLKVETDGSIGIDSNGIRFTDQKTFIHLLPYPSEERDETHASNGRFFYIVSGGRMHVFMIRPYEYRYRNHSIRTISEHFVGTYSGIYHRGIRMTEDWYPKFTDGYIREYNGKVFIPFDSLKVFDIDPADSSLTPFRGLPPGMNHRSTYDIRYLPNARRYIITTQKQLLAMDSVMKTWEALHMVDSTEGPVVIAFVSRYVVAFAQGRKLMYYYLYGGQKEMLGTLPENVLDGAINGSSQYILCPSGLYMIIEKKSFRKLVDLQKAHTLLANRDGELVIGTDAGLMHYDVRSGRLSTLVKGVEFNRRALALLGNRIHAGSIHGLYILDNDRLKDIIQQDTIVREQPSRLMTYTGIALGMLLLATLALSFLYLRTRKRYEEIREQFTGLEVVETRPKLSREDIETFIRSDLSNASLKSIKERFQTNNGQIYNLLQPEKPGNLINRLRMEIVQEMRASGASARDIAQKTGLSESYVRRIWNK